MNQTFTDFAIPTPIMRKLRLVRQRKLWVHVASAVVAALAVLLVAMGVAMLIDWLATLYDSRWRVVLTTAALTAAATTAIGWLIVARRRLIGLDRIAGDVDRHIPSLQERWTTMTRLGHDAAKPDLIHPAMLRRVATEAVSWEPHVEPDQVVPLSTLTRAMIGLTAVTAVLAVAVVLDARRTLVLMQRFWRPGSSISATELVDLPGDFVIGRGEPLVLTASVKGTPADRATLFLRSDGDRHQLIPLVAHGTEPIQFAHRLRSVEKPFAYRFRAGDGQTDWYAVNVADRPEIEALTLEVTPPAYTRREAKKFDKLPPRVSAIQGSTLELAVRAKAPVQNVRVQLGDDQHVDLTAGGDGWYRWTTTLQQGVTFAPLLTESHGLTNRRPPKCRVSVYPDHPPVVQVISPEDQIAVRPDDTVQLTFSARDDVGIGSAELLVYDESAAGDPSQPIAAIPIALGDEQGARSVQQTVSLDLKKFVLEDGAEVSYEIRVREERGAPPVPAADPNPTSTASRSASPAPNSLASNTSTPNRTPRPGKNSASPGATAQPQAKRGESPAAEMAERGSQKSVESAVPRTATSRRQALSTDRAAKNDKRPKSTPSSSAAQVAGADAATNKRASANRQPSAQAPPPPAPNADQQANNRQSPTGRQTSGAASNSGGSHEPPSDSMPTRTLDVGQASSSKRMRLKIDELAGSFSGQQRAKLEMAIAPELEALDEALAKGQRTARGVLDQLASNPKWRDAHDRDVTSAELATGQAQEVINKLQQRSQGTPYAFIGLQVVDIGLAHVDPARHSFWNALQSDGDDRAGSVRDGWQHLGRARELVAELRGQFERARREFQLADAMERVKKMYQVYIENTHALLQIEDTDPRRYNRKLAEFKLDDEYLARLREVMELRRNLQAELARILGEDPRLLRRFMDSVRNRTNNIREELADLAAEQEDLNREVQAWARVEEAERPKMARLLMLRQVQDADKITTAVGELQSRYQAWLPLVRESKDAELAAATKMIQQVATTAGELSAVGQKFVADAQRVKVAAPATENTATPGETPAAAAAAQPTAAEAAPPQSVEPLIAGGQRLYDQLHMLEVAFRQLAAREEGAEAAIFGANRLVDTRRLIADTSAWVRQMRAHHAGKYTAAAEVDQYRLAMKTDALAGKLGSIEQSLSGLMQREDGSLPEPIAATAREFLATLDNEASPSQLAAVYALHGNQVPQATQRQTAAGIALAKAEKLYDELMRLTIAELDKLPVQDPIADLLDDPTLDELLAQLEQESPIQELLGIPERPSNLRIIGDWLRPNTGLGGIFVSNQMRLQQQRTRQRLEEAYRRAIARALKEEKDRRKIEIPNTPMSDWNRLVSKLGDDLRQGRDQAPPEQYRRAIEQYFSQISRAVADDEKQAP